MEAAAECFPRFPFIMALENLLAQRIFRHKEQAKKSRVAKGLQMAVALSSKIVTRPLLHLKKIRYVVTGVATLGCCGAESKSS